MKMKNGREQGISRIVYLEPPWKVHAAQHRLVNFPPDGYEFVTRETPQEKIFGVATRWDLPRLLLRSSDFSLPTGLVKSLLERWNKPPSGSLLTYAVDHLILRPEPWVMELEFASLVAGRHPRHIRRFRRIVQRYLNSSYCKRVLCTSEAARRTILDNLDSRSFQHKVEVVHYTVPPQSFTKAYRNNKVKMLFVGADILKSSQEAFEYKGGREVLETFAQLRQQFGNLEMMVRAKPPPDVAERYAGMEGLRILDKYIPHEELKWEYLSADIFILPSHTTIPSTLLEAMSFELPVVTVDSWANAEYIEDNMTGLVVPRSRRLPYYYANTSQPNFGTREYNKATQQTDPEVIASLVKSVRCLIENPDLRRRLGRAGRWEIEKGRFSLTRINEKLGRIFDEAIGEGRQNNRFE